LNTKEHCGIFQTGVYNVMISTDVVQAGLNIPQCSLVLRYDFVPDSIGTVQARVRARATDCKYCLITTKGNIFILKINIPIMKACQFLSNIVTLKRLIM
ncbi:unnamed protein product, partial [Adineta steineri]